MLDGREFFGMGGEMGSLCCKLVGSRAGMDLLMGF